MQIRRFVAATILFGALPAMAQTEPNEPKTPKVTVREVYAPYTELTLGGADIIGEKRVPVGARVVLRTGESFPSQIEERAHFKRDLVKSIGAAVKKSVKATEVTP